MLKEGKGQLIDIRTPEEFNAGHIEGATMIDFYAPTYRPFFDKLDKTKPFYMYCRSGNRTGISVGILQGLGFTDIVNLQKGLIDWNASGYPLTVK